MGDDLASANVNRSYSLAATSIAIFTFTLIFLYPRFASGEIEPLLFQATLIVMGASTFALVFASFFYYGCSLVGQVADAERDVYARRADRLWLIGYTLLVLTPSLILFAVRLTAVASVWLVLWLAYLLVLVRYFPVVSRPRQDRPR